MKAKAIVAGGLAIVLLGGGVLGTLWVIQQREPATSRKEDGSLERIVALRQAGSIEYAHELARAALETEPDSAELALEAGRLALMLREGDLARQHMQRAWDNGSRNLAALLVLVDEAGLSKSEKAERFDELSVGLEMTPDYLDAKASLYSQAGRDEEAIAIRKTLFGKEPTERRMLQVARKMEMAGRRLEAIRFLRECQEKGSLSLRPMNLLFSLLVFDNRFDEADSLWRNFEGEDPHGEWRLKWALFQVTRGNLEEARAALAPLTKASGDHPVALAVAHQARLHFALLQVMSGEEESELDQLAAVAMEERKKAPTRPLRTPLLAMSFSPKRIEAEALWYEVLRGGDEDEATLLPRVSRLLEGSPVVEWVRIRDSLTQGRPQEALDFYAGLEKVHSLARVEALAGLFYKSPLFLTEIARAFSLAGRPREGLVLLNHLHERGNYSPASIRLYARLMPQTGSSEDALKMSETIVEQFGEDVELQLAAISQASQLGDPGKALELLRPVLEQHPDHEDAIMLELMLLLAQGEVDLVRERCAEANLPNRNKALVRARASAMEGKIEEAEEEFRKAMGSDDLFGHLDFARFLVEQQRHEEAAGLYRGILTQEPGNVVALQGLAVLDELAGKPQLAIRGWNKIQQLVPNDPYAHSRLAKLHLQNGNSREALILANKVLSQKPDDADASYLQVIAMIQLAGREEVPVVRKRKLGEVEQRLSQLVEQDPDNPQLVLHMLLARAFFEADHPEATKAIYQRLLAVDVGKWDQVEVERSAVERALEELQ
jgi:tetratricopeptide (TPR) repeat protein